ncbi:hypothetical protein F8M41_004596 [Gigaspora margarita]|uniref:Uncharacterized protein n=1 Tax=Gigaspora margarita TaxID=4874 RepID=A0A8H4ERX0_GIGMA|nr:hypothetical protein F8M41_004596 [Gigaspora margarita]
MIVGQPKEFDFDMAHRNETPIIFATHYSRSNKAVCMFAYNVNDKKNVIDEEILQILKLHICAVDVDLSYKTFKFGQIPVKLCTGKTKIIYYGVEDPIIKNVFPVNIKSLILVNETLNCPKNCNDHDREIGRYEEPLTDFNESAHKSMDDNETFDRIRYSEHFVTINDKPKIWKNVDEKKDKIDLILDSHTVYAVGPDFQNDYSTPYIACWVANPLTKLIMEQISDLFNHEYEVVYHLVKISDNDGDSNNASNSNGNISGGFSTIARNTVGHEENKENDGNNDDSNDNEYHDADGGDDNDNKNYDNGDDDDSSGDDDDEDEICVSPIPFSPDDKSTIITIKEKHSPRKANNDITSTNVREKGHRFQLELGAPQNIKGIFSRGRKKSQSLTANLKEWTMIDTFGETIGNKWRIHFTDNGIFNTVLGSISNKNKYINRKTTAPELIKSYSKLVHQLEVSYTDIKKLNSNFEKHVKKKCHSAQFITVTPQHENNNITVTTQNEINNEFITRKLFPQVSTKQK